MGPARSGSQSAGGVLPVVADASGAVGWQKAGCCWWEGGLVLQLWQVACVFSTSQLCCDGHMRTCYTIQAHMFYDIRQAQADSAKAVAIRSLMATWNKPCEVGWSESRQAATHAAHRPAVQQQDWPEKHLRHACSDCQQATLCCCTPRKGLWHCQQLTCPPHFRTLAWMPHRWPLPAPAACVNGAYVIII